MNKTITSGVEFSSICSGNFFVIGHIVASRIAPPASISIKYVRGACAFPGHEDDQDTKW